MEYKLTAVQPRNEWNNGYGQMMDYAITVEGHSGWIKLTQKLQTPPPKVGQVFYGIIEEKTNTNGTAFTKFKKLQRDQTAPQGTQNTASPVQDKRLDYIVQMLEELTGRREFVEDSPPAVEAEAPPQVEELVDDPFEGLGI